MLKKWESFFISFSFFCGLLSCGGGNDSKSVTDTTPQYQSETMRLGQLYLYDIKGNAVQFLDISGEQVLTDSNPYFTSLVSNGHATITLDKDTSSSTSGKESAQVTFLADDGTIFTPILSAPAGLGIITPLTTLADYLARRGDSDALSTLSSTFGIPISDITSSNPTDKGKKSQQLTLGVLAKYQNMEQNLFDSNKSFHKTGRDIAASEAIKKLPLIVSTSPTFTNMATMIDWLTSQGFFLSSSDFSSSIVTSSGTQTVQSAAIRASFSGATSTTGDNCPEPNQGISYSDLGKMILGSTEYRAGYDEQKQGVNQLFAGSCGAVYNQEQKGWHTGIDYQVRSGADAVEERRTVSQYSLISGEVVYVSPAEKSGNGMTNYGMVTIRDERNANRYWRYLHLDSSYVSVGDRVNPGCKIGLSGGTGKSKRDAFSVHSHIEAWEGNSVSIGTAVAYQKTSQAVIDSGFINPRLHIDSFVEPHGKSCNETPPGGVEKWNFAGQVVLPTNRLIRATGFTKNGSIYTVNDMGIIDVFSKLTFAKLKSSSSLTAADYDVNGNYVPSVMSAVAYGSRVALGANGANAIPILDVETLTKIDSYPYTKSKMGKNSISRARSMFPESIRFSTDGRSITVFGGAVFNIDGTTVGEKMSIPAGIATSAQLSLPNNVCDHTAYRSRNGVESTIAVTCDGRLFFISASGTSQQIGYINSMNSLDGLIVSKNGDALILSIETNNSHRKLMTYSVLLSASGIPTLTFTSEFADQIMYRLYPVLNQAENRLYVQRYTDIQIMDKKGKVLSTVPYPTNISGSPAAPTAKMTFSPDESIMLVPLSTKILVFSKSS